MYITQLDSASKLDFRDVDVNGRHHIGGSHQQARIQRPGLQS